MTTLGQRWPTVVLLADGWRWVHNVGPTLGQHQHVLDEIWKATPFIVLALQRRAKVRPTLRFSLLKLFIFGWLNNIGPTLGQRHFF